MARTRSVSAERLIAAPADKIFDVLADPSRHCEIDGSDTLVRMTSSHARLALGSTFSMRMQYGIPYRVKNKVLEFEDNRLIAWAHWHRHRWRYELTPRGDESTLVRETFDWSNARSPHFLQLMRAPERNLPAMEATLERLAAVVETPLGGC